MNSAVATQVTWTLVVLLLSPVLIESQRSPFTGQGCEVVDLIFILDRSWSLRSPENFQKELNFVAQVVSVLDFDKSRVSVVTFSDDADLNIKFNDYFRLDDFQRAVRALPWIGGNTYTHKAIEMMLQEYNQHVRDRAGITTIGVVVTDGGSTDPYKLEDVVKVVHNDRIEMFAIGVGDEVNQQELEMLASGYDHVYLLNDLNSLSDVQDKLTARFCRGTPAPSTQAPPQDITDCSEPVDLVFVLDSSWSLMTETNFQKELKFVTDVVSALSEQMGQSRLSVITFSDQATLAISFSVYSTKSDFVQKVLNLPWIGGNTYTDKALEMMYKQFDRFREVGRRPVGVVITDGGSTDPFRTQSVIKKVKEKGITMFAIGVGMSINKEELKMIASQPVAEHEFMVDDLDGLNMLRSTLVSRLCPGPTKTPLCRSEPADIFFLVDKSSSLKNRGNFLKELEFIARIIDTIIVGVGPDDSRVGLISFSTEALLEFGMSEYTSNEAVKRAVLALNFTTGDTYTHKAFDIMIDQFKRFQRTSSRVKKIGFVVTDGQSTDPNSLKQSIREVQALGIEMYAVGAGDFDSEELLMMASDPSNVFHVDDLDDLRTISVELNLKKCT
ncbi:collagen alpha-5(VI) chain-like isoform X3 [Crassostrea virginica]|uniref:Collagen alpha-1(XII) chain-like isoform X5 n=1 Tax=Crassostrea virginica TaxID=6565 RepID=A0A8B8EII0_CRAVI|nr:collagen alpha-1(XII) chain-like isoform X5 [Crassostrea virginica]